MRFEDSRDGWQQQLNELIVNSNIRSFLRAISKAEPVLVQNVNASVDDTSDRMCHQLVKDKIDVSGGQAEYGWIIAPWLMHDIGFLDHSVTVSFHCNWRDTSGNLVNVSPMQGQYHIFLSDSSRKYDFDSNTSFNNRTIYLDECKLPAVLGTRARNVNYFTSQQYASRDRNFEKFKRVLTKDELFDVLRQSGFHVGDDTRIDAKWREYLCLKLNASI